MTSPRAHLSAILDDLLPVLRRPVGTRSTVSGPTVLALLAEVHEVLARPIECLLQDRRLAFCYLDAPLAYPASAAEVDQRIGDATLVIQKLHLDNSGLGRVCAELALGWRSLVTCSVYVSSPHSQAFDMHVDEWDVHIIQLHGRKRFELVEDGGPQSYVLGAGDCLFVPRDMAHRAVTVERSIHLSVGVHR